MSAGQTSWRIVGGRLLDVSESLDRHADLLIVEGHIAELLEPGKPGPAVPTLDAEGCWVLPALTDLHTTLNEPGFEHRERLSELFATAAAGGYARIVGAPTTRPTPDHAAIIDALLHRSLADGRIVFHPLGAATTAHGGQQLSEIGELIQAGAVGISDGGKPIERGDILRNALDYLCQFSVPYFFTCEDPGLAAEGVMHEGLQSTLLGLRGVPAVAEELMVHRAVTLSALTGCPVHLTQLSTRGAVALVRTARAVGVKVTSDVSPHHLWFTDRRVRGYGTEARVRPPLREEDDRQALLQGVNDGTIDAVASGHAPQSLLEKESEFEHAQPGVSSLETTLPAVLTLVEAGVLRRDRALDALCHAPARVLGLPAYRILPGEPAQLVVAEVSRPWTVDPRVFATPARASLFAGVELVGRVRYTLRQGHLIGSSGSPGPGFAVRGTNTFLTR